MYNREKTIATLREIHAESMTIAPYVVIAQPRRNKEEIPAQTFNGHGTTHVDMMGHSHGFIDIGGEKVDVARNYLIEQCLDSGAKYLFFIGDDTVVPWNAFDLLHKTAEANPNTIVTGVYYIKCSNAMIMVRTPENHVVIPNVDPGQILDTWQTGMDCMLIPISILKRMKEQDPDLPFTCVANGIEDIPFVGEDNFFTYRTRKMGIKTLCNTDVQCLHMDTASGKYTAHPSVDLKNYYTNIKPTTVLTLEDKAYIDHRWTSRLPEGTAGMREVTQADADSQVWLPGKDIPKLIEHMENPVGVEIGTAEGYTTKYLLETVPNLTLYGIDPYTPYRDWDGRMLDYIDADYNMFMNKVEKFAGYQHIRNTSDFATHIFKDGDLDFVFIDGLHTYEQVSKDCENYWPKLKSGGIMIGHDFSRIQGVNDAVNEFASTVGKKIQTAEQDLWYIIKD